MDITFQKSAGVCNPGQYKRNTAVNIECGEQQVGPSGTSM